MNKKAIFLDRDGVINHEVHYLRNIKDFKFITGVFDSCLYFAELGYEIIIITNQSGIARGFLSKKDYLEINNWMLNQFSKHNINILEVFHCPHGPESKCNCRKPKPGMFLQAKNKHNINMKTSWMIGDKEIDIEAANLSGIENTILVKSIHNININNTNAKFILDSIREATQIIKS